ncbi:MAG: glucosyltransferase domain-containing protein [Lachnospiraceae bacterium]|nr:glucosyltransferase domain-containing protein [Lachnospiraceae bacterium]
MTRAPDLHNDIIAKKKDGITAICVKYAFGFLLYFLLITHDLVNFADGLWENPMYRAGEWELSIGRWLLRYIDKVTGGIAVNPYVSIVSLFFFVLGLQVFWDMTGEKHGCFQDYLTSALFLANPYVCSVLSYRYTALSYSIGFFLAVCSMRLILLSVRAEKKPALFLCLLSSVLIACCMAIYQTYLSVMILLAVFGLYLLLFREKAENGKILRYLISGFLTGSFGGIVYFLILKAELHRYGVKLSKYKGANSLSLTGLIKKAPTSFREAYSYFVKYYNGAWNGFIQWNRFSSPKWMVILLLFALTVLLFLLIGGWKARKAAALWLLPIAALLPAIVHFTAFVLPEESGYLIQMSAPDALLNSMILALALMEIPAFFEKQMHRRISLFLITAFGIFFLYGAAMQTVTDQQAMKEGLQADETLLRSITAELAGKGLYSDTYRYAIIGSPHDNPLLYTTPIYDRANSYAKTADFSWARKDFWERGWNGLALYRLGIDLKKVKAKKYIRLKETDEEIAAMPAFPAEGSILVRKNVVIVKVSEY